MRLGELRTLSSSSGSRLHSVTKAANAPGLQLADLIARPIGRFVMNQQQPNRAFDVIVDKLAKSPKGEFWGWGLKVFP